MTDAELQKRLSERQGIGLDGSFEALDADAEALVHTLGAAGAAQLVRLLCARDPSAVYDDDVLFEIVALYAVNYADALYEAALPMLRSDGPPHLIVALGLTHKRQVIEVIERTIDARTADNGLVTAMADAWYEIGSRDALPAIEASLARTDIDNDARTQLLYAREAIANALRTV